MARLHASQDPVKQHLEKTEAQRPVDANVVTEAFGQVASEFGRVKQLVEHFDATGAAPPKTGEEMLGAL